MRKTSHAFVVTCNARELKPGLNGRVATKPLGKAPLETPGATEET
ncbi:hypothetical protein CHELA40_30276 [Chelatococcus asaccharovorans]|nr:hypothetical protein CHELA17_40139 [Chelatococcus asaccharovorans]CAH1688672.1 hypothetical protein CHELA40_30276 [Chelatococcus asaccharovorans]